MLKIDFTARKRVSHIIYFVTTPACLGDDMGRRIIICAVVAMSLLILLNSMAGLSSAQEKMAAEKGEKTKVWIHNVYELQNMSKNLSGNYALTNDIDATITKNWNGGTFDGNGHKIINMRINRSSQDYVGLFGSTSSSAIIENVGLVNVSVSGDWYVGGSLEITMTPLLPVSGI